jgi:hypothetical protein
MKNKLLLFLSSVIFSINASGQPTIQWQKTLGGTNSDFAYSIQPTSDGGYIVTGETASNNGDVTGLHGGGFYGDCWVVKVTAAETFNGKKLWVEHWKNMEEAFSKPAMEVILLFQVKHFLMTAM